MQIFTGDTATELLQMAIDSVDPDIKLRQAKFVRSEGTICIKASSGNGYPHHQDILGEMGLQKGDITNLGDLDISYLGFKHLPKFRVTLDFGSSVFGRVGSLEEEQKTQQGMEPYFKNALTKLAGHESNTLEFITEFTGSRDLSD